MARRHPRPNDVSPWPFIGMAAMACVFFLFAASGMLAPWWVVVVLLVVWSVSLFVATVWWSRHPRWVVGIPVALTVLWFPLMIGGGIWLGWNA